MPAVTFNALMTAKGVNGCELSAVTNLTSASPACSVIVGAGSNITFVFGVTFSAAVSAISGTVGGIALTQVPGSNVTATLCGRTYFYYATVSAGTLAVAMSWTTSSDVSAVGVAFNNAAGGVGGLTSANGASTAASVTQPTVGGTNDAILALFQNVHSVVPSTTNGTNLITGGSFSINQGASYLITPASSQAMTASLGPSDNWLAASVDVLNAAAASGGTTTYHWNLGVNI